MCAVAHEHIGTSCHCLYIFAETDYFRLINRSRTVFGRRLRLSITDKKLNVFQVTGLNRKSNTVIVVVWNLRLTILEYVKPGQNSFELCESVNMGDA